MPRSRRSVFAALSLAPAVALLSTGALLAQPAASPASNAPASANSPAPAPAATNATPPAAKAGSVSTVKPERAPAAEALRLPVRTAPAEQAFLYSRATGTLAERRVDLGDVVKAGDLLAVIAAPEVQRGVDRAQAAVAQASARAELARANLRRTRVLTEQKAVSKEEGDVGEANAKIAEADLLAAQAEVSRLEALQSFQQLRAPFDGVVAGRQFDRGDLIPGDQSGTGRWLFHVVRMDELRALLDAPPVAALALTQGQSATVTFSELPGRTFPATLTRIGGVIDNASGTMRIELTLPNADRAIPAGLSGTATLTPNASTTGALRVPVNALVQRGGRQQIAQVKEGRVVFTPVRTGRNFGTRVEILEGVTADTDLIVNPNALLQPGQPVL